MVWQEGGGAMSFFFFFFNEPATTEIYTLALHDALPIWWWEVFVLTSMWSVGGRHCELWVANWPLNAPAAAASAAS